MEKMEYRGIDGDCEGTGRVESWLGEELGSRRGNK